MISAIELLRKAAVDRLFAVATMQKAWKVWNGEINRAFEPEPNVKNILALGSQLSDIFASTREGGRDQGSLSGGGTAWESLVAWYLNLCLAGTRTVVIKENKLLVPEPISKCKVVMYRNFPSNTESDLVAITFPDKPFYTDPKFDPETKCNKAFMDKLSSELGPDMRSSELCVIQCKTNWNDNAQIPMLWDMVYSARGFNENNINVGSDNFSISSLGRFSYAFVTVPTQKDVEKTFKPTSVAVQRVNNISGGNFWGMKTKDSVASSLDGIILRNFQTGTGKDGVRPYLSKTIKELSAGGAYSYFRLS